MMLKLEEYLQPKTQLQVVQWLEHQVVVLTLQRVHTSLHTRQHILTIMVRCALLLSIQVDVDTLNAPSLRVRYAAIQAQFFYLFTYTWHNHTCNYYFKKKEGPVTLISIELGSISRMF